MYRYDQSMRPAAPSVPAARPPAPPPAPARAPRVVPSDYVPMRLRVFDRDTIYWVTAHLDPTLIWATLLEHLIKGIRSKTGARLPQDPFTYTYYNMDLQELLTPAESIAYACYDEILFIHKSEFVTAYDDARRARLVTDLLRKERNHLQNHYLEL